MKYTVFVFRYAGWSEYHLNSYAVAEAAFNAACAQKDVEVAVFMGPDQLINHHRKP